MDNLKKITSRIIVDERGCWIWQGPKTGNGYGAVRLDGKTVPVHRASYILYRGAIPPGMVIRHKCDVPLCCNPDHLMHGTHGENVNDTVSRGRWRGGSPPGEGHGNSVLTNSSVIEIKKKIKSGITLSLIARQYGVDRRTISDIAHNRLWKHISI
jgi:hypothetical protein